MALVIDLKPGEKVLIGDAVITNDKTRTRLHIAGDAPIMREKDVMKESQADTPCKKIYFLVQCMYLARDPKVYHDPYFTLAREIQHAAPSASFMFLIINQKIMDGHYYKALKEAKELIRLEEELVHGATNQNDAQQAE